MQTSNITSAVTDYFDNAQVHSINRLVGGVSADVFRVELRKGNGAKEVIVLRAMGKSGLNSALEFSLISALHEIGVPVPKPIHLDASRVYIDKPFLLMKFVEGTSKLPGNQIEQRLTAMALTLADVHKTPTNSLPKLPLRLDPVPELLGFLPSGDEWSALRAHCASLEPLPYQNSPCLLHGDFWVQNLIWDDDQIAAILDWEDAAFGDPISDLACALLELRYLYDDALVEHFLGAYRREHEVDPSRLVLWQVYVAAAAQQNMSHWGLEPSREAHMRSTALRQIRECFNALS